MKKLTKEDITNITTELRDKKAKFILMIHEEEGVFHGINANSQEVAEMIFTAISNDDNLLQVIMQVCAMAAINKQKDKMEIAATKAKTGVN